MLLLKFLTYVATGFASFMMLGSIIAECFGRVVVRVFSIESNQKLALKILDESCFLIVGGIGIMGTLMTLYLTLHALFLS